MGLESYVIHLLPDGVEPVPLDAGDGVIATGFRGKSGIGTQDLIDRVEVTLMSNLIPVRRLRPEHRLIADGVIEMMLGDDGGYFRRATLVGCFSWYDEGLPLCYRIACAVNNSIGVRVYHQAAGFFSLAGEDEFCRVVRELYRRKYYDFIRTFGNVKAKTLPDQSFYDFYRRSNGGGWGIVETIKGWFKR